MNRAIRRRRNEHGAAAVETAICLCFIVLPLTFAAISYAFLLSFRQSMSQAAAEGARSAAVAVQSVSNTERITRAKSAVGGALQGLVGTHACGDGKLTCDVVIAGCKDAAGAPMTGQCATVNVSYLYRDNPLVPAFLMGFVLPKTVSYSAVAEVS